MSELETKPPTKTSNAWQFYKLWFNVYCLCASNRSKFWSFWVEILYLVWDSGCLKVIRTQMLSANCSQLKFYYEYIHPRRYICCDGHFVFVSWYDWILIQLPPTRWIVEKAHWCKLVVSCLEFLPLSLSSAHWTRQPHCMPSQKHTARKLTCTQAMMWQIWCAIQY